MRLRMRLLTGGLVWACAACAAAAQTAGPSLQPVEGPVWSAAPAAPALFTAPPTDPAWSVSDPFAGFAPEDGGLRAWRTGEVVLPGHDPARIDRLRLTTGGALLGPGGAPLRFGTPDAGTFEADRFDVAYLRDWPGAVRLSGNGYELDVTPRAGLSVGSDGGGAEAGATVRFGEALQDRLGGLVKDGQSFGERSRWYLFAAASGRAVGYNFLRSGQGWRRSGMSTDEGYYVGDAQAGVAWRKGDVQASFGYVHREIKIYDREQEDGFVAFQLSIKPER